MKKIIFVTDLTLWSMGKGRGGPAFNNTVEAYIRDGWEVYIVSDVPSNAGYPLVAGNRNFVIQPTKFKKSVLKRKIGLFYRFIDHRIVTKRFEKQIKELIGNNRNTVLYAYEIYGVKACEKIARQYGIPFVTRFQGTIMSEYNYTYYNRVTRYPHIQALSTRADLVIMTNDGTKGNMVLDKLQNASKVLFLLNGLDLMDPDAQKAIKSFDRNTFRREVLKTDSNECVFLTVSRLVSWKRLDRAIDGFSEYLKRNETGKLVIVGDGDAREELEERVRVLNIQERVMFAGSVLHDDVYSYMMASDVFLSLYDLSNVGNPLLEAMTLGKCIITYDVGDTKEFIQNEKNGILLDQNSIGSLPLIMARLAKDEELRKRLGISASQFAKDHFWNWTERMNYEVREVNKLLKGNSDRI